VFLARLSPRGILSVSRWYFEDRPGEIYRIVSLASTALLRAGITDPRSHMIVVRNIRTEKASGQPEGVGTLLVSPSPFSAEDIARIETLCRDLRFDVVMSPRAAADATFERLAAGVDLEAFTTAFPINIAPPTDNSPFFFQMLRLRDLANLSL